MADFSFTKSYFSSAPVQFLLETYLMELLEWFLFWIKVKCNCLINRDQEFWFRISLVRFPNPSTFKSVGESDYERPFSLILFFFSFFPTCGQHSTQAFHPGARVLSIISRKYFGADVDYQLYDDLISTLRQLQKSLQRVQPLPSLDPKHSYSSIETIRNN